MNDIILQKDEVESVSYMSIDRIRDIFEKGLMNKGHYKVLEKVLEYSRNSLF